MGKDANFQAIHSLAWVLSEMLATPLEGQALKNIRAVVVKGDGTDVLAPAWPVKMPVINAAGRSADEIVDVLRDRLS